MNGHPCGCGCGQVTRGEYRSGHRPLSGSKPYRAFHHEGRVIRLHRLRAEMALGRQLPPKAVVHHADGSTSDDAPLVICENDRYHKLLHARMRIKAAGGNPDTERICCKCRRLVPMTRSGWCKPCARIAAERRRRAKGIRTREQRYSAPDPSWHRWTCVKCHRFVHEGAVLCRDCVLDETEARREAALEKRWEVRTGR